MLINYISLDKSLNNNTANYEKSYRSLIIKTNSVY